MSEPVARLPFYARRTWVRILLPGGKAQGATSPGKVGGAERPFRRFRCSPGFRGIHPIKSRSFYGRGSEKKEDSVHPFRLARCRPSPSAIPLADAARPHSGKSMKFASAGGVSEVSRFSRAARASASVSKLAASRSSCSTAAEGALRRALAALFSVSRMRCKNVTSSRVIRKMGVTAGSAQCPLARWLDSVFR